MSTYAAIITATFLVCGPAWVASLIKRAHDKRATDDQQTADDHGEPSRADVEAGWLNEDGETWVYGPRAMYGPRTDTPIDEATAAHIAKHAAADLDDEWRRISDATGGAA